MTQKKYTVNFSNVGRDKHSWSLDTDILSWDLLVSSIKKKRALLSKGIDVEIDLETLRGSVYAGFREVGQVQVTVN